MSETIKGFVYAAILDGQGGARFLEGE